ncbi:normal mucosa of esophagus-specific gene 1 protein-like [Ornithodoros turicata]
MVPREKSSLFGIRFLKKHVELMPLIVIMSIATGGCVCFCMYTFMKPEIWFNKKTALPPWMTQDNQKYHKLLRVKEKFGPDPVREELEKVRREIGAAK